MSGDLIVLVHGTPAPQGSKRHVGNGVMVESSAKVRPWRQDVKYAALAAHEQTCGSAGLHFRSGEAVEVVLEFYLPRPKGHHGTGRNAGIVKASAPMRPATKPDIDKLTRSTLDALGEAGIWADDSQVARLVVSKDYADANHPVGAYIEVRTA